MIAAPIYLADTSTWVLLERHRTVIAATAELHGITVLHYYRDYDRISSITGQPTEWVVPRGSLQRT